MHAALFLVVCLTAQVWGAKEPTEEQVGEYRAMVREWSERAARIVRELHAAPSEEAHRTGQVLQQVLDQARQHRTKRDAPADAKPSGEGLDAFFANVNQGLKNLMTNVTSSPVYKDLSQNIQKLGDSFGEKGKELLGKVEEQLKSFQNSEKSS